MLIDMKGNSMKNGNVASGTFLVRNYNYQKSLPSCSPPPLFALHEVCVFSCILGGVTISQGNNTVMIQFPEDTNQT